MELNWFFNASGVVRGSVVITMDVSMVIGIRRFQRQDLTNCKRFYIVILQSANFYHFHIKQLAKFPDFAGYMPDTCSTMMCGTIVVPCVNKILYPD